MTGHGVVPDLIARLEATSRAFFALDEATKLLWRMALGERAWRGYFPLGGELTSRRLDWKEGLHLGTELPDTHPLVRAGTPVHGHNLDGSPRRRSPAASCATSATCSTA